MKRKTTPLSSTTLPVRMRKAGRMKDRRLKREGENKNPDLLEEYEDNKNKEEAVDKQSRSS